MRRKSREKMRGERWKRKKLRSKIMKIMRWKEKEVKIGERCSGGAKKEK